jgi:hypothetical protein
VDPSADVDKAPIGRVHRVRRVDVEPEVLDADLVIAVLATVDRAKAQELLVIPEVDDLLRAAIAAMPPVLLQPERASTAR